VCLWRKPLGAFAKLVEAGKVRALGVSNCDAAPLRQALAVAKAQGLPRYEVMQPVTTSTTAPTSKPAWPASPRNTGSAW
jgi:aryl-alcohol dehydrogenase-like predicted oxidoreductase